jgi:hypothetical protein
MTIPGGDDDGSCPRKMKPGIDISTVLQQD